jgi:large subunit ribosomal protein L33
LTGKALILVCTSFIEKRWFNTMRDVILLACEECKQRNYSATKDKKKQTGKISVKKYCKFCNEHTVHKETKA